MHCAYSVACILSYSVCGHRGLFCMKPWRLVDMSSILSSISWNNDSNVCPLMKSPLIEQHCQMDELNSHSVRFKYSLILATSADCSTHVVHRRILLSPERYLYIRIMQRVYTNIGYPLTLVIIYMGTFE